MSHQTTAPITPEEESFLSPFSAAEHVVMLELLRHPSGAPMIEIAQALADLGDNDWRWLQNWLDRALSRRPVDAG